jgi:hypothetical protein
MLTGNGGDPDTLWMFWEKSKLQKKGEENVPKIEVF